MAKESEITLAGEFASTMQQLVAEAEAEKTSAPVLRSEEGADAAHAAEVRSGFHALDERIGKLERTIAAGLEKLAAATPPMGDEISSQMQRIDEHMVALCKTETVNQRLFNSLHQELKDYRDNFLRDSLQKPFIRDLVVLFDDLSSLASQMSSASGLPDAKQGVVSRWSANLENAIHSLVEVMHRMEVTEIEPREMVDRALHRVVSFELADFPEDDGRIVMRVKRGFFWRGQVLRPEEVVAKRIG